MMAEAFGGAGVGQRVEMRQDRFERGGLGPVAGIGGERRHPGQVPGARGEALDGVGHGLRVAALQAVGEDQHHGAARGAGKARYG